MLKETLRRNKGITLIALVVTIIVLLILAGISITMLTGQNGILNRTNEAQEKTKVAQIDELVKVSVINAASQGQGNLTDLNLKKELNNNIGEGKYEISGNETDGWTITVNEKEYKIDSTKENIETLPTGGGTTPYLPNNAFTKKEGDLSTGLVIKDSKGNEYVWVEVPITIYSDSKYNTNGTPSSANDWEKIRDCLKAYTVDYSNSSYKDTNTDGITYSDDYKDMLKSVYTNGGFWIGRYEAGYEIDKSKGETVRDYKDDYYTEHPTTQKVVIKENAYPYNWVRRDQAEDLSTGMNYNGVTSSLIYGLQWDLTLKYIETKNATTKENLTINSSTIGNHYESEFTLNRGKFAKYKELSDWFDYNSEEKSDLVTGGVKKPQSLYYNAILLTTGATEATNLQNIYDIAGNVWEWTKENSSTSNPCVHRGGSYYGMGSSNPAKNRDSAATNISYDNVGFRIVLWK